MKKLQGSSLVHAKLLGERVLASRKAQGLTQETLSEKAGVTTSYLSLIERGLGNPTLDIIVNLAKVLDSTTSYMLGAPTP